MYNYYRMHAGGFCETKAKEHLTKAMDYHREMRRTTEDLVGKQNVKEIIGLSRRGGDIIGLLVTQVYLSSLRDYKLHNNGDILTALLSGDQLNYGVLKDVLDIDKAKPANSRRPNAFIPFFKGKSPFPSTNDLGFLTFQRSLGLDDLRWTDLLKAHTYYVAIEVYKPLKNRTSQRFVLKVPGELSNPEQKKLEVRRLRIREILELKAA